MAHRHGVMYQHNMPIGPTMIQILFGITRFQSSDFSFQQQISLCCTKITSVFVLHTL